MRSSFPSQSRRRFVCAGGCAALALPAGLLLSPGVSAQDKIELDNPTAAALNYTHDATQSNRPSDDQTCSNCLHYTGEAEADWGPCAIFLGALVAREGWCAGWVPKG